MDPRYSNNLPYPPFCAPALIDKEPTESLELGYLLGFGQ
jgi:hypothetical protein